jgi:hypothetical protein
MPPDRSDEGWRDAALLLDIMLAAEDALSFVVDLSMNGVCGLCRSAGHRRTQWGLNLPYASTYSAMLVGAGTAAPSALRPSM